MNEDTGRAPSQNASNGLKPGQLKAIEELLQGRTIKEAAEAVGVTPRAIYRWNAEPAFVDALRRAEGEALDQAARRLGAVAGAAIDAIERILADETLSPTVRLRAADLALAHAAKLRELRSFDERLRALEEAVQNGYE